MRPEHVIWIDDKFTKLNLNAMIDWCQENVGEPYPVAEYPNEGVPIGFDLNNKHGKWCCYRGNHVGDGKVIATWCFRDAKDATFFALKWA